MAGIGKKFKFHGAFSTKARARAKEKRVDGFIKRIRIGKQIRYAVMTQK